MQAKDSGMGHFALFLPRGIGAGAQGKPGVVVSQNGKTVLTSTPFCRAVVAKVGLKMCIRDSGCNRSRNKNSKPKIGQ